MFYPDDKESNFDNISVNVDFINLGGRDYVRLVINDNTRGIGTQLILHEENAVILAKKLLRPFRYKVVSAKEDING